LVAESFDSDSFEVFCKAKLAEPEPPILTDEVFSKLSELLKLYRKWIVDRPVEQKYLDNLARAIDWARTSLIRSDLDRLTDEEFVELFRDIPVHFTNIRSSMRYYITNREKVLSKRVDFTKAMAHLANTPDEQRFAVLNDFVTGDKFQVKNLKKAFWSEMIRARFDDVPLLNEKTLSFFDGLGVFLGDDYGEELRSVATFYSELRGQTRGEYSMNELTHLEHFVKVSKVGREFMERRFGE